MGGHFWLFVRLIGCVGCVGLFLMIGASQRNVKWSVVVFNLVYMAGCWLQMVNVVFERWRWMNRIVLDRKNDG